MKRWPKNGKVLVKAVGSHGATVTLSRPQPGRVARVLVRNSAEAWVALDERLTGDEENHHPFPADDERGTHIPTDLSVCEAL